MVWKNHEKKGLMVFLPLAGLLIFMLFPFIWTFITSIKAPAELYAQPIVYWPKQPGLQNYVRLFREVNFFRNMLNSGIVAILTVGISLLVSLLAAYAFSRYAFKGKYLVMGLFLLINMFPNILLLIPLYSTMRALKLLYTPFSLVIAYSTFTIPFSVWLLTGYLNDLPQALEEAGMVDGCNRRQAFIRIILPLTRPGIIATGIYIFITAWNEFIYAVMFTNEASRTIPVALQALVGQFNIQWDLLTAGGIVTIIPILIMFLIVQKKLIEGLTAGAVKG